MADHQADALQNAIENDLAFIGVGANFFHAVDKSYWKQFPFYAKQVVENSNSLIALQWLQRVEYDQVKSSVEDIKAVNPDFEIFTITSTGKKVIGNILPDNKPLFILSDIYPKTDENLSLLGFYSSRERFDLVLNDLITHERPNISDKLRLLQDGYDKSVSKSGLLVYHPVFSYDSHEFLGVVVGVLRSYIYFRDLVTKTASEMKMSLKVEDLGFDAYDDPLLFKSSDWDEIDGESISRKVVLPNREWQIDFKISETLLTWERSAVYSIAISGFFIACLIAYIIKFQSREKERLSVMLDNKTSELQWMAERDPLTQQYNRRIFNDDLKRHVQQKNDFALIGFDIDHFKLVNDTYGHLAGDEVLIHVTRLIVEKLLEEDKLYRSGGDEFCIISQLSDKLQLQSYLEEIRESIANSSFLYNKKPIFCSLSIGAVIYQGEEFDTLYHKMDKQMYCCKENGRNSVSIGD
ncbi:sensor domain-containing diguanylate cyclase [Vibrio sagamiensis NBRC 104589]|uniref:diguanylate cyclase n=2 Tax=Vibrio sagamiensis TaxID=512650 RepID=A0A511QB17_9VIBR|nr:sensor domain-containing diguanylate cyclase [Vibrio sagamiensis NBRC 104589]